MIVFTGIIIKIYAGGKIFHHLPRCLVVSLFEECSELTIVLLHMVLIYFSVS